MNFYFPFSRFYNGTILFRIVGLVSKHNFKVSKFVILSLVLTLKSFSILKLNVQEFSIVYLKKRKVIIALKFQLCVSVSE